MDLRHLAVPLELKSADADRPGVIEGYGSIFGNVDLGGDIVVKGAFAKSLAELAAANAMPVMFWGHNKDQAIGEWTEIAEDERGLRLKGLLWIDSPIEKAHQAWRLAKSRSLKGLSIGYQTDQASIDPKTGIRSLISVTLKEVSIVPFPMNERATLSAKAAFDLTHAITDLTRTIRAAI